MKTLAVIGILLTSSFAASKTMSPIHKQPFGKTEDGRDVYLYTLKNHHGMQVEITNFGGTVVSILVPDRSGRVADVVLGFDSLDGYESKDNPYFGATVGRYANRIAKGRFTLDGKEYRLAINNPPNSLHGGVVGFDKKVWETKSDNDVEGQHLRLHYLSKDMEEGFPGNLSVNVVFTLTEQDELRIDYSASTDKKTVLNLTNHCYFNLGGQGEGDILGHVLTIFGGSFNPIDATVIPTGDLRNVAGTPFDFRQPTAIGARINAPDDQLKLGNGYDHNWVLNGNAGKLILAAQVVEPHSGRILEVLTTEPGVQFYTGNFLNGVRGKKGKLYQRRYGFSLETQHFPDSPNHPNFPSTELNPGQSFHSTTVYRFSVEAAH
jgi:aldose 1-epimerase